VALEVSKKSSNSVPAAFAEFTRKERLDSANQWKCSGCKKRVCASKQLTIFRPPLSLCLQLKRFTFGGGMGGFGGGGWGHGHYAGKGIGKMMRGGSKITKPIDFPANLHLPLSDGRKCEYSLTGMVIHVGGTASSGHYTAFVKKPGNRDGQNQWYHMDDSYVEAVSEKVVLQQKDAYLLFYCRKEVKLELPALPSSRKSMTESEAKEYGLNRARARAASIDSSDLPSKSRLAASFEQKDAHDGSIKESRPIKVHSVVSKEKKKPMEDRKVDASKQSKEMSKKMLSISKNESEVKNKAMTHAQVPSSKEVVSPLLLAMSPSSLQQSHEIEEEQSSSSSSESSSSSSSSTSSSAEDDESVENENKSLSGVRKHLDSTMAKAENDATPKHSNKQVSAHEDGGSSTLPVDSNSIATSIHKSPKTLQSEHSASVTQEGEGTQITKLSDVKQKKRTMVLDNHQPGKIEIVVGSLQKTNLWKPAVLPSKSNGHSDNELLGTFKVQRWDDEDEVPEKGTQREAALKIMDMKNQERKRKMRLNRWDSALDEGRVST
jgi:ubiquitin carboxyl-terminal hydrolase 36/42